MVRVKLEDVCERGTSNLKTGQMLQIYQETIPYYGAAGYIGNVDDSIIEINPYVAIAKGWCRNWKSNVMPSSIIDYWETMQYLCAETKNGFFLDICYYVVKYMHVRKIFYMVQQYHIFILKITKMKHLI